MSLFRRFFFTILITICFVAEVYSNDICNIEKSAQSSNRLGVLDTQNEAGCFGYESDDNALTKSVRSELTNMVEEPKTAEELAVRRDQLLELLVKIKGSLEDSTEEMNSTWKSYASIALNEMGTAEDQLRRFESLVRAQYWLRSPEYGFFEQLITGVYLISYGSVVEDACSSNGFSDECKNTIESINTLTRHINLVYQVLQNPVFRHWFARNGCHRPQNPRKDWRSLLKLGR